MWGGSQSRLGLYLNITKEKGDITAEEMEKIPIHRQPGIG